MIKTKIQKRLKGGGRESGVTQMQYTTPAEDLPHVVQRNYASQITPPYSSQFHADAGVKSTVACTNASPYQTGACTLQSDECSPVTYLTNNCDDQSRQVQKQKSSQSWYAQLSVEQKANYIQRQRIARQQKRSTTQSAVTCKEGSLTHSNGVYAYASPKCIDHHLQVTQQPCTRAIGSSYSGMAKDLTTESNKNGESSEHKRQRERERYSSMTAEQKDIWLQNNRDHKKLARTNKSPFINSPCTPVMQPEQSKNNRTDLGDTNIDEEFETTSIFEPFEQEAIFEDNLDTIQEEQTIHDDDEECRIFSGSGDVFDSYQVRSGVSSNQNDDPYDYVYHNLPTKHHVLKPVKDCVYCGAMRLQYEGPAFCCKKGKVKIVTPEVPQELRRLFTSQVDEDAKYFRKHIRYFNTHFSFTSLGVTLDKNVSNAARTGVYTFRAQGALYYKMDDMQWAVDMYIKMETMRLDFYSKPQNQKLIRADLYQGVVDVIDTGETRGSQVGKRIVLPRTFPGGDRDMQRRFLDAMTIVQRFGKPDYFITMTCNPHWEEITSRLEPGQTPQDRPDLVARVYMAKLRIETLDRSLQDIMGCDLPFGGKVVVFGGDFRQVLPVVTRGTRAQITDATLQRSYLWEKIRKIRLKCNMRAQTDQWFSSYLLRIGDGTEETIGGDYVRLPDDIVIPYSPTDEPVNKLIEEVFPSLHENAASGSYMSARAILSTKNEHVDNLNTKMIERCSTFSSSGPIMNLGAFQHID
uniref:Uncharacterized protein n=1 Tax=Avena sativa TaxID=4498 RepID=A0ACD5ZSL2_AVESA